MCAVAVASSPVFSPSSRSLFCKTVSSPDHHHHHHYGSCSPSPRSGSGSVPVSSPFRVRLQKSPSGLRKEGLDIPDTGCSTSLSSAGPVKRKRPARIDIPVASLSFGAVAEGVAEVEMEVDRENYSVYCKKGRRAAMEDRYSAVVDLDGDSKQALFGVFDGHGGVKAAEFTAENLHKNITNELRTRREEETVVEAVKCGYLTTDTEFLKEDVHGGTCCVTALIKKNHLVVSNAGDCRAVMSRGGVAEALTSDHRPSREDEKERIETSGGYVDCCRGVWRLNGSLAVSRGIGDRHLKQWVIAEPETKVLSIEPDCEFLVLASDGLWDKISNQEAIDLARPLFADATKPDMLTACKRLTDLAVTRGSADDISVMVILLGKFIEPGVYENLLQL